MTLDLFDDNTRGGPFAPGAILLPEFALAVETSLLSALQTVVARAPFRHMVTRRGFPMSVATTNCGSVGWVSDRSGYRYDRHDPQTGQEWPAMPDVFRDLAVRAAHHTGYPDFNPDACLINRYEPGAQMSLHQDCDETDFGAPIVSVSLGLPAIFLFGGMARTDPTQRIPLHHGDVVVWGGETRLAYHGIRPLKPGVHPVLGAVRINLTFRVV